MRRRWWVTQGCGEARPLGCEGELGSLAAWRGVDAPLLCRSAGGPCDSGHGWLDGVIHKCRWAKGWSVSGCSRQPTGAEESSSGATQHIPPLNLECRILASRARPAGWTGPVPSLHILSIVFRDPATTLLHPNPMMQSGSKGGDSKDGTGIPWRSSRRPCKPLPFLDFRGAHGP